MVEKPPANVGDIRDPVGSLRWEDPLEEAMPTHSSIPAWRIPWTEEAGGLQFIGLGRLLYDRSFLAHLSHLKLSSEKSCCSAGNNQVDEQAGITQHRWQLSRR